MKKKFVLLSIICLCSLFAQAQVCYYVSPNGNDNNPGTPNSPVATIQRAQELVRKLKVEGLPEKGVRIILKKGMYSLGTSLKFSYEDGGQSSKPIVYEGEACDSVTVSAGRKITNWKQQNGNHWVAFIPEVKEGQWYFRQLFAGEKRLTRARIPNDGFLITQDPLTKYVETGGKYSWGRKMLDEHPDEFWECRCGFQFAKGDIQYWENWEQAEILTYHSWESSWQTIRKIDSEKNEVYLNSPSSYPIGTFGNHMRYCVENIPAAMDQPGEWYLDGNNGEIHYLAAEGEDPNTMNIYAPYLDAFITIVGDSLKKAQYISFKNINFKYAAYNLGIYEFDPICPKDKQKEIPHFPTDRKGGYAGYQAAPSSGQSVDLVNAENISFEKCRFNHLGANAIRIGERSFNINIVGCEMYDMGSGGVIMGRTDANVIADRIPFDLAPAYNVISNCYIHDGGKVHPAAVGLCIMQSHNNLVENCEISYTGNTGISNGWCWTDSVETYNFNNRLIGNYIHHAAQYLADAAGYYNNGASRGTVFKENFIDQIIKAPGAHGVVDAMGMDSHSRYVHFERNVIGETSGKVSSFARQTGPWNFTWKDNSFDLDVKRPVFEHSVELDPARFTIVADFKLASTFLDLSGWSEEQWVLSKNGDLEKDGYYGMLVEGGKAIAYMNIGGGKENIHKLVIENSLKEEDINRFSITYDDKVFRFSVNGASKEVKIGKIRKPGNGNLVVAHLRANCLRYSVNQLLVFNKAFKNQEIQSLRPSSHNLTFSWAQPGKQESDIDFEKIKREAGLKEPYKTFLKKSK